MFGSNTSRKHSSNRIINNTFSYNKVALLFANFNKVFLALFQQKKNQKYCSETMNITFIELLCCFFLLHFYKIAFDLIWFQFHAHQNIERVLFAKKNCASFCALAFKKPIVVQLKLSLAQIWIHYFQIMTNKYNLHLRFVSIKTAKMIK